MLFNSDILPGKRLVPLLILCFISLAILLVPFKITAYGFLPPDDALRHAAKAVSGKNWDEILVLRNDIEICSQEGWDFLLGVIHKATNWNADALVVFSIFLLFLLFCLIPALLLERPEAWAITLLVITIINPSTFGRLFLGRPYIFTMAVILILALFWPKLRNKKIPYGFFFLFILLIAASTWLHCAWYLFLLPILCFFLAREWRAGLWLGIATIAGIIIGALLTGHPFLFLKQISYNIFLAFGNHLVQRTLVSELQPFGGEVLMAIPILGILTWRKIRGAWDIRQIDNPIFILAMLSWVLGFISSRFWLDWGIPAISIWMTLEFQEILNSNMNFFSWRRLILTVVVLGTFYIAVTADTDSRWTYNLTKAYLTLDDQEQKEWLPEPGGIVYSNSMTIFYDTFFKNPSAPWRYILGFEATLMPPEDLAIFRKIQWNFGAGKSFEPWVKKMRPEDRLIIRGGKAMPPDIAGLEWHYAVTGIWIGRLPRSK